MSADAVNRDEVDTMLLREWRNARIAARRRDAQRLALRAVDKCYQEFKLLGFVGFTCRMGDDGFLLVEGIPAQST